MALLWIQPPDADSQAHIWAALPLDDGAFALTASPTEAVRRVTGETGVRDATALLLRSRTPAGEAWLVMCVSGGGVRLNGAPLLAGIRVLTHRDEIHVDGVGRVFFSTERLARVEPFPGGDRPVRCPRCKQVMVAVTPAVHCPQCNVWHHQSDEFPCWTYSEHCALCPQPTELDAGYRWTPEAL